MVSTTSDIDSLVSYTFAGLGALVTTAWLLTCLVPTARRMMLDRALYFLLDLLVVGLLWWTAYQSTDARRFWELLAAGWTLNLLGNVIWSVHHLRAEEGLPVFSLVDGLYMFRYALVWMALWCYPEKMPNQQLVSLMAIISTTAAVAWLWLFRPTLTSVNRPYLYFLGRAVYPILDVGLIYVAILKWMRTAGYLRGAIGLLILALITYGVANWLNFRDRAYALETPSSLAAFFWPLSDIFTGLAALYVLWGSISLPPTVLIGAST